MEKDKKVEYISKTTLLDRGWTEKSINEILPPPKLVDNPHYKCASPMKLWELKLVKQKERTKKFKEYAEKKAKRSETMMKSVLRRQNETNALADTFSLEVERIDMHKLRQYTLNAKWNWYMYNGQDWKADDIDEADEKTIARWEVNYIRHNLTNYDEEISRLYRKVGKLGAYTKYREKLMEKIKEVYPELKDYI